MVATGGVGLSTLSFDPLTRPAPAGESAGCGPPSPPRGRGLRFSRVRGENVETTVPIIHQPLTIEQMVEKCAREACDRLGLRETGDAFWILVPSSPVSPVEWISAACGKGKWWSEVRLPFTVMYQPSKKGISTFLRSMASAQCVLPERYAQTSHVAMWHARRQFNRVFSCEQEEVAHGSEEQSLCFHR